MRWKASPPNKRGDIRVTYHFALIPVCTDDNEWLWLERYQLTEGWYVGTEDSGWAKISLKALDTP